MSNVNLQQASRQWASRPADERFSSLQELHDSVLGRRARACEAQSKVGALTVVAAPGDDVLLRGSGLDATFTNFSFERLCGKVGASPETMAKLPAANVASDLNYLIRETPEGDKDSVLLFDRAPSSGALTLRSITSERYSRLWDVSIVGRLIELQEYGWRVPPARPAFEGQPGTRLATEADVLADRDGGGGLSIKVGDEIAPAGLYAGDRDLFAFLVNEQVRIEDGNGGLSRGFFVENSEVYGRSFKLTTFLYRHVCGNHIVWGAENVARISIRHVGDGPEEAMGQIKAKVTEYMTSGAEQDTLRVKQAKAYTIALKKDDVVDEIFRLRLMPRGVIEAAYDDAEVSGENPTTAWGLAQGITHLSQAEKFASRRAALDAGAGKVMQIAF